MNMFSDSVNTRLSARAIFIPQLVVTLIGLLVIPSASYADVVPIFSDLVTFNSDPDTVIIHGPIISVDSSRIYFFASDSNSDLHLHAGGVGNGRLRNTDTAESAKTTSLVMQFTESVTLLSLVFGVDPWNIGLEGGNTTLTAYLEGTEVGQTTVSTIASAEPLAPISVSGIVFDEARLSIEGSPLWAEGHATEIVDNVGFGNAGVNPPVASAGDPYEILLGDDLQLAGSASDPDGGSVTASWDMNSDGVFDDAFGVNPFISSAILTLLDPKFGMSGEYPISIQAVDNVGNTIFASTTVTVIPEPATAILLAMGLLPLLGNRGTRTTKKTLNGNQKGI